MTMSWHRCVRVSVRRVASLVVLTGVLLTLCCPPAAVLARHRPAAAARRGLREKKPGRRWQEGDIRLAAGRSRSAGIVLLYHKDKWGTVCDDIWSVTNSDVVCRQLGYRRAARMTLKTEFGPRGRRRIWIAGVQCDGAEGRLLDCQHVGWSKYIRQKCQGQWSAAGVVCQPTPASKTSGKSFHNKKKGHKKELTPNIVDRKAAMKSVPRKPLNEHSTVRPTSTTLALFNISYDMTEKHFDWAFTTDSQTKPTPLLFKTNTELPAETRTRKPIGKMSNLNHESVSQKSSNPSTSDSVIAVENIRTNSIAITTPDIATKPSATTTINTATTPSTARTTDTATTPSTAATLRPATRMNTTIPSTSTTMNIAITPTISITMNTTTTPSTSTTMNSVTTPSRSTTYNTFTTPRSENPKASSVTSHTQFPSSSGVTHVNLTSTPSTTPTARTTKTETTLLTVAATTTVKPNTTVKTTTVIPGGKLAEESIKKVESPLKKSNESLADLSKLKTSGEITLKDKNRGPEDSVLLQADSPGNPDVEMQLIGGRYNWEGRLEIRERTRVPQEWGTICGAKWGMRETMVVCRELGLNFAKQNLQTNYFGGQDKAKLYYSVNCTGREAKLSHCSFIKTSAQHLCPKSSLVAGVVCSTYLPDLVPDLQALSDSVRLQDRPLYYLQCALEENCLSSSAYEIKNNSRTWRNAMRRLLRFSTIVHNRGVADFRPYISKGQWQWHTCHMHFHSMEVFAHYDILNENGTRLAEGSKASFCLEDTVCARGASRNYQCAGFGDQGLSVNCSDNYLWDIDCQWIDITDIQPGSYTFLMEVNPTMLVAELDFDNNVARCDLWYSGYFAKFTNCRYASLLDYRS